MTGSVEVDGQTYEALISISVATGSCIVSVTPEPESRACEYTLDDADLDPDAPGFQAELLVTTNCPDVTVTVNDEAPVSATAVDGEVTLEVTLDEGDNFVTVDVTDANDNVGTTGELEYTVDTFAPVVSITDPDPDGDLSVGPDDDRDGDLDNGVQIDVVGTVAGVEAGTTVNVAVDGTDAGSDTTDAAGAFRVEDVTFDASGTFVVTATADDGCGNEGSAGDLTLEVSAEQIALAINAPADGSTLLAEDDLDAADGYQTDFEVAPVGIPAASDIYIECVRPASPAYETMGTAARGDDETTLVRVTLDEGDWICRAGVALDGETVLSSTVDLTVDSDAPIVVITEPEDGSATSEAPPDLAAFVTNIDAEGITTYAVGDGDPIEVPLVDSGFLVADLALTEGPNTFTVQATDSSGNTTTESATVEYDTTAPTVTFVDPEGETATLGAAAFHGDETYGEYLYDVVVESDERPLDDELCLTANLLAERCVTATEGEGAWTAVFTDTFILPGRNDLDAEMVDRAGNPGSASQQLLANNPLPRVEITTLFAVDGAGDDVSSWEGVDGLSTAWSGRLDLLVDTNNVPAGSRVQLVMNGIPGVQAPPDGEGLVRFENIAVSEGLNAATAWVVNPDNSRGVGFSAQVGFEVDTTPPFFEFTDLSDGDVISTATAAEADPAPG